MTTESLRQNKDLVQSLNEIYHVHSKFARELDEIKNILEQTDNQILEKIINLNTIVIESKNEFSKRMRQFQLEQTKIQNRLDQLEYLNDDIDDLREENKHLRNVLKKFENDMIKLQSHIISTQSLNSYSNTVSKLESDTDVENELVDSIINERIDTIYDSDDRLISRTNFDSLTQNIPGRIKKIAVERVRINGSINKNLDNDSDNDSDNEFEKNFKRLSNILNPITKT